VYEILMSSGVEVPRHMIVNRGEDNDHTDSGEYHTVVLLLGKEGGTEKRDRERGGGSLERGYMDVDTLSICVIFSKSVSIIVNNMKFL
jgi:hypothetical protein